MSLLRVNERSEAPKGDNNEESPNTPTYQHRSGGFFAPSGRSREAVT
jgi:hypothetical protein